MKDLSCGETIYDYKCKGEFERINESLSRIEKSLHGNGKPGVLTRLDRMEQSRVACLARLEEERKDRKEKEKRQESRRWDIVRPFVIMVITAGLVGAGVWTITPEPVSQEDIKEAIRQVLKTE